MSEAVELDDVPLDLDNDGVVAWTDALALAQGLAAADGGPWLLVAAALRDLRHHVVRRAATEIDNFVTEAGQVQEAIEDKLAAGISIQVVAWNLADLHTASILKIALFLRSRSKAMYRRQTRSKKAFEAANEVLRPLNAYLWACWAAVDALPFPTETDLGGTIPSEVLDRLQQAFVPLQEAVGYVGAGLRAMQSEQSPPRIAPRADAESAAEDDEDESTSVAPVTSSGDRFASTDGWLKPPGADLNSESATPEAPAPRAQDKAEEDRKLIVTFAKAARAIPKRNLDTVRDSFQDRYLTGHVLIEPGGGRRQLLLLGDAITFLDDYPELRAHYTEGAFPTVGVTIKVAGGFGGFKRRLAGRRQKVQQFLVEVRDETPGALVDRRSLFRQLAALFPSDSPTMGVSSIVA